MAIETYLKCGKRGLSIVNGDVMSPEISWGGGCRNLMLANPPYLKEQSINDEYKMKIQKLVYDKTGIRVNGKADLSVYHFFLLKNWLCEGGISVWFIPNTVLQTNYGVQVKEYLLSEVELKQIHIYNLDTHFDNADVSSTIIVFENKPCSTDDFLFTYGESVTSPEYSKNMTKLDLLNNISNWMRPIYNAVHKKEEYQAEEGFIKFDDVFTIKRGGIATGANSFFVMERAVAHDLDIPEIALKPIVPKIRTLSEDIIEADEDGYPNVLQQLVLIDCDLPESEILTKYPEFYEFLQSGKQSKNGRKAVIEGTLVKSRPLWYKQEQREIPPYLFSYMGGREKEGLPALRFLYNKSKAVALNNYFLLYPREWILDLLHDNNSLYEEILHAINTSSEKVIENKTRLYSGGLHKLEPGELKGMPIIGLPEYVIKRFEHVSSVNRD